MLVAGDLAGRQIAQSCVYTLEAAHKLIAHCQLCVCPLICVLEPERASLVEPTMAAQDSFDRSLQDSLIRVGTMCDIANRLWGSNIGPSDLSKGQLDLDAYFAYYTEQCNSALYDRGRHTLARTHQDIVEIAHHITNSESRDSIKHFLNSKLTAPHPFGEEDLVENTIDLVASLLVMMQFRSLRFGISRWKRLTWTKGPLREFLRNYFNTPPVLKERVKLEQIFNARNLERIAGIRIVWTDNLTDHLRITDEEKTVAVFHHVSFLENQQKYVAPCGKREDTSERQKSDLS